MTVDDELAALPAEEVAALLWRQHHVGLVRMAVGLTGDVGAAEEIVQDGFVAPLTRWHQLRDPSAALAYLRRVVINAAHRRWRMSQRLSPAAVDDREALSPGQDVDLQFDVLAALALIPYRKRACLVLQYYADMPQAEVADALGISVGTVKSQTSKGLRQLAAVLDDATSRSR